MMLQTNIPNLVSRCVELQKIKDDLGRQLDQLDRRDGISDADWDRAFDARWDTQDQIIDEPMRVIVLGDLVLVARDDLVAKLRVIAERTDILDGDPEPIERLIVQVKA